MANSFKFLAKLNGNKYSVIVDNINGNNNKIQFSLIYKKLRQIDTKLNISFDNHLFEVLDKDFDDYVVITDENQLIDNLSRFRITSKDDNKTKANSKVTTNEDQSRHESSAHKKASPHKKSSKDSKSHSESESNKTISKESNKSIDALNRNLLDSIDIPVLSDIDIKLFKEMKYAMCLNRHSFESSPESSGNWTRVSHKLKSNPNHLKTFGSDKVLPKNIKQFFFKYLAIYEQVLEYVIDEEMAVKYLPIFKAYHNWYLRPFLSKPSSKRLNLLKEKFDLRVKLTEESKQRADQQKANESRDKTQNKSNSEPKDSNKSEPKNKSHSETTNQTNSKKQSQRPESERKTGPDRHSSTNTRDANYRQEVNPKPQLNGHLKSNLSSTPNNGNKFSFSHSLPAFIPLIVKPNDSINGNKNKSESIVSKTTCADSQQTKKVKTEIPEVIQLD